MAKSLTALSIAGLKPKAKYYEEPDGAVRGLKVAVQPSGTKSFILRYRNAARVYQKLTIGRVEIGLAEARKLANAARVEIANGRDPAADKQTAKAEARSVAEPPRDLVETVVEMFIEEYAKVNLRESSLYETKRILNREVVCQWQGRLLSEIKRSDVNELLKRIVNRDSPIMANRTLAALRRMCGWAVEEEIIEASPCDGVTAKAPEKSRDRALADEELKAAWQGSQAIGWPFGAVIQLLILTGQRRDEVAEMRWAEIDFEERTWTLPRERVKNDQAHTVPLSDSAIDILKSLPKVEGRAGLVFTTNGVTPVSGFSRAKDRLDALMGETQHWTLHDLRRTFSTGAAELGVPIHVTEAILNHKSGTIKGVAAVYNRYSYHAEKRAALDAWGRYVDGVVNGKSAR